MLGSLPPEPLLDDASVSKITAALNTRAAGSRLAMVPAAEHGVTTRHCIAAVPGRATHLAHRAATPSPNRPPKKLVALPRRRASSAALVPQPPSLGRHAGERVLLPASRTVGAGVRSASPRRSAARRPTGPAAASHPCAAARDRSLRCTCQTRHATLSNLQTVPLPESSRGKFLRVRPIRCSQDGQPGGPSAVQLISSSGIVWLSE